MQMTHNLNQRPNYFGPKTLENAPTLIDRFIYSSAMGEMGCHYKFMGLSCEYKMLRYPIFICMQLSSIDRSSGLGWHQ
jgi:hypothetical protein